MLPANARQAHMEMGDTPMVDKGAYVMLGNDDYLPAPACGQERLQGDQGLRRLDHARRPGDRRQGGQPRRHQRLQVQPAEARPRRGARLLPRDAARRSSRRWRARSNELGVPHPLHIHGCNLGVPGNIESTLATMRAAEGLPHAPDAHPVPQLRHAKATASSPRARAQLAEAVNTTPNVSIDVGQVLFGQTVHGVGRHDAPVRQRQERASQEVGGDGHRVRRRLRRGAVPLPRQELRQRAAMGDRARDLPAGRRSVAHVPHHRSPERRAVHQLSAPDPAADGQGFRDDMLQKINPDAQAHERSCRDRPANTRSTRSRS